MRRLILTPIILVFVVAALAQSPSQPATEIGVSVLKFSWHKLYRPGWDAPRDPASRQELDPGTDSSRDGGPSQLPATVGTVPFTRGSERTWGRKRPRAAIENQSAAEGQPLPNREVDVYTYQLRMKNVSGKTIEAVDWEYLFKDSGTGGELARHRFQSFRRAEAGKTLTLTATSYAPPSRVLNATIKNNNSKPFEESVTIKCVLYSDGTAGWRAMGTEEGCESIKNLAGKRGK